jgi:hypothetical protein
MQEFAGAPAPGGVLQENVVDAIIWDASTPSSTAHYTSSLAVSNPLLISPLGGLVTVSSTGEGGMLRMFEPFTPGLWAVLFGSLLGFALMMVMVNMIYPGAERLSQEHTTRGRTSSRAHFRPGTFVRTSVKASYHTLAACFGGEDAEWFTAPERLLRLSLLGLVLVSVSTYTANLAAFFTRETHIVGGPKDYAAFSDARVCVTSAGYISIIQPHVPHVPITVAQTSGDISESSEVDNLVWCHERLRDGSADIIVSDANSLQAYLLAEKGFNGSPNCAQLAKPGFTIGNPTRFSFAMRAEDTAFERNLSAVLDAWLMHPAASQLKARDLRQGETCEGSGNGEDLGDTQPIGIEGMQGLFVFSGAGAAIALLSAVVQRLAFLCSARGPRRGTDTAASDVDSAVTTEGEMLRTLLAKVDALARSQEELKEQRTETFFM